MAVETVAAVFSLGATALAVVLMVLMNTLCME